MTKITYLFICSMFLTIIICLSILFIYFSYRNKQVFLIRIKALNNIPLGKDFNYYMDAYNNAPSYNEMYLHFWIPISTYEKMLYPQNKTK